MPRLASVRPFTARLGAVAVFCFATGSVMTALLPAGETALDRYVAKPDHTYAWKIIQQAPGMGGTHIIVDLKSQTWRTPKEVNRTVWQHWLNIVRPDKPASNIAFLFIDGGSNDGKPPKSADPLVAMIALQTHAVVAELKMIPNEPLIFNNDGVKRKEDDLIGYTWDEFLKGGDAEWLARLPMVKSAVRGMDCVQEVLASKAGGQFKIDKFVVAGGSKRGWTTWCTAAVDKRVTAIIPISIDCLNNAVSMLHHVAVYGFYTEAVGDYFRHHIMQRARDPRMKLLNSIEDPYSYIDRFTMPKFVMAAAGDQYFCPDSSQFYYPELPGEKLLRYIPNADHSLKGTDALASVIAYFHTVITGTPRPRYSWTFEKDGSIRVTTGNHPKQVTLWQATNPKARDFRMKIIGKTFVGHQLSDQGHGVYLAHIDNPERGWTASFVELVFDVGIPFPLKVTTAVRVTPDTLPYRDLDPTKAPPEPQQHVSR